MKKVKGIAAFAAAVMVLNSATIVFADTDSTKGKGTFEGYVPSTATEFHVELPTIAETEEVGYADNLKFILDPNELIKETNGERYGKTFDPGNDTSHSNYLGTKGLYFPNADRYYDYSGKSDVITAKNTGTTQVDVSVKATLTDYGDNVELKDASASGFDWTNVDVAGLYLAITKDESTPAPKAITVVDDVASAKLEERLDATSGSPGELHWNSTENKYEYQNVVLGDPVEYNFYLEGQAGGNWEGITECTPEIDLVWTLKEVKEDIEPTITTATPVALSSTDATTTAVDVDLGSGRCEATDITSITFFSDDKPGYNNINILGDGKATFNTETKKISFTPAYIATIKAAGVTRGTVTVTFNNDKVKGTGDEPVAGSTTRTFDVTIS